MAEGINLVTKIAIIVISIILSFLSAYHLFVLLTDNRPFGETQKIISLVFILLSLTLSVLCFWGAFTENGCLCQIAIGFCFFGLILGIWNLIQCFLRDKNYSVLCDTQDYVIKSAVIVVFGVMIVAVCVFIRSIE